MSGPVVLLGPQRGHPRLSEALAAHGRTSRVAVITAGWRHDEAEIGPLTRHLGDRCELLPLYGWFDSLCLADPSLSSAYTRRQQRIIAYKHAYRDQLTQAMAAVSAMQARVLRDPELYGPELQFTHQALRALDARALQRLNELRAEDPTTSNPWDLPSVRAHHDHAAEVLSRVDAVLIAGGHVGVLRNRMFFFGLDVLLPKALSQGVGIFAWSAGAMALTEQIFLFYDDPPEGEGNAEILDSGLSILPRLRVFPHAERRLRLQDRPRMERLAGRLHPAQLVTLEPGAWLEYTDTDGWTDHSVPGGASVIQADGTLCAPSHAFPFAKPETSTGDRSVVP